MKLCRFKNKSDAIYIGLVADNSTVLDLTPAGITQMSLLLENDNVLAQLADLAKGSLPRLALSDATL